MLFDALDRPLLVTFISSLGLMLMAGPALGIGLLFGASAFLTAAAVLFFGGLAVEVMAFVVFCMAVLFDELQRSEHR